MLLVNLCHCFLPFLLGSSGVKKKKKKVVVVTKLIYFSCPHALSVTRQNYNKFRGGNYVTEITYYTFTASIQSP